VSSFQCGQRRAGPFDAQGKQAPPYKNIWRQSPDESEAVGRGIGGGAKRNWLRTRCDRRTAPGKSVRVERRLAKDFARSALGAIFDLLGELFDLLGFFYEGDGEGGVCVGMLDLVL
jgi:hypothetical protein